MPEGKGPRVVQARNSLGRVAIGFICSDSTSQGPELVVMEVDAQTDKVSFDHKKGIYGENFVEQGEDTSHLGDDEREAFTHKTDEPFVGTTDAEVTQKLSDKQQHKLDKKKG